MPNMSFGAVCENVANLSLINEWWEHKLKYFYSKLCVKITRFVKTMILYFFKKLENESILKLETPDKIIRDISTPNTVYITPYIITRYLIILCAVLQFVTESEDLASDMVISWCSSLDKHLEMRSVEHSNKNRSLIFNYDLLFCCLEIDFSIFNLF